MEKSIHTLAQELKDHLKKDPLAASRSLIDFAKTYALNPQFKREALLLKLDYANAQDELDKNHIITEMLVMVNNIVSDYLKRPESDLIETQKYEARKKALHEHLKQNLHAQQAIIFEGIDLGKKFKKSNFYLQKINLVLRSGEITGVVGENGNGKTTLFRLVVGDLLHNEGQLCFPGLGHQPGTKPNWFQIKNQIAYIPQEIPKWQGSLRNNLHLAATLHGLIGKENEDAVNYIIHRLGLSRHEDKSWSELSGGYKLRFTLAKALVWRPKILVIDEPLANLDINAQSIVLNDLRNLANSLRHPIAILISSQHLHELESVTDNIVFLKQGEVIYNGRIKDFGKERSENSFEIECTLSLKDLETRMSGLDFNSIDHNGLRFIVHTPLSVSQQDFLRHLLAQNIEVNYFRNISQSTKKLFV